MKSLNTGYIPQVDQLRLIAALLVFGFHFFHVYAGGWQPYPEHPWAALVTEGHTGVALFFVLSGFIFMQIAQGGGEIAYGAFLRNRLLRIAPLFLTVFVLAISINRDTFRPADVLYLLFSNIGDPPTSRHLVTGPAWSISVEFTFYLIFPFLASFMRERGAGILVKLVALLLVIKTGAFLASDNPKLMLYSTLVGRFDQFLIGMLATRLLDARRPWIEKHGWQVLGLSLTALVVVLGLVARHASYFSPDQDQPFLIVWGTIEAAIWAGLIVGFVAAKPSLGSRIDAALATAGMWSFSIYMWHMMVIFIIHQTLGPVGGSGAVALMLNALAVLALVLAFAWLSFTTIEAPFLALRKRYVDHRLASVRSPLAAE